MQWILECFCRLQIGHLEDQQKQQRRNMKESSSAATSDCNQMKENDLSHMLDDGAADRFSFCHFGFHVIFHLLQMIWVQH